MVIPSEQALTRPEPGPQPDVLPYVAEDAAGALQHILATGDVARLTNEQRVGYYLELCRSLGLNPRSRPFDWLMLDGKLVLYPNKSCAEQIRAAHQISIKVLRREPVGELFVVEVEGRTPDGRTDVSSKYVPLTKLNRQTGLRERLNSVDLANAYAKAETGAKRRLAFSMVGLAAVPDPDELKGGRYVVVDGAGNVIENPTDEQKALAADPSQAHAIGEPTYEDLDAAPVVGGSSQAPTPDALEPVKRSVPRQTWKRSEDDVKRLCGAWFATVKGTYLDADDERHAFVEQWTARIGWPQRKQTNSLRVMFVRMTDDEAAQFLAHARQIAEAEKAQIVRDAETAENAVFDDIEPPAETEPF